MLAFPAFTMTSKLLKVIRSFQRLHLLMALWHQGQGSDGKCMDKERGTTKARLAHNIPKGKLEVRESGQLGVYTLGFVDPSLKV